VSTKGFGMLLLCIRAALLIIAVATYEIDNWFFKDSEQPHYDTCRIQELVLYGSNPVITGFVRDSGPEDDNRLFTMREYDLQDEGNAEIEWFYNYEAGEWDDDGYAILQYTTGGSEVRFLGVGFHQVDINTPQQSTDEKGLAVLLDDDGDTVCTPYIFDGDDWYDACCRDVVYIGSLNGNSEVYATCGWYNISNLSFEERGFLEIAYGNTPVTLIEDSGIDGSWESILYDSAEELLVMGGFLWNSVQDRQDLRVGCVDLSSTPYEITEQEDWGSGIYSFFEGPIVLVDDGLYIYLGDDGDGVVAATLWCWDTDFSPPPLVLEDTQLYTNSSSDFSGYDRLGVFAATYVSALEEVIILVNAEDTSSEDPYILVKSIEVNPVRRTLGDMSPIATLEVVVDDEYDARGHDFVFTSTNPVEGIGGGIGIEGSDSDFWIFEIEDIEE